MIPKIIHLCWLSGDEYPPMIKKCIESWKRYLPDYEIMLWDTKRFDVNSVLWTKQAFECKKYAFAADYIRLYALYHYGGIYLDSDVLVYKSFDDLLDLPYFIGEDFGYNLRKSLLGVKQEEGIPNILLSHIPVLKPDELSEYNIFLFLAGHTHGGQLFPLQVVTYIANACFSGLYADKNKKNFVYVSEGVNNALVPMRVGSKRMFPIITIEG